ncbi:MAG: alpha/beta hydrolase, partial [Chloroflexota bacterium]|nr:alpha/beta hydrolase [Chloroflexota bacterium]
DKNKITVVGYSFGALTIMDGLKGLGSASKFVLISPPPNSASSSHLRKDKRPLLVVTGEKDLLSPPTRLSEVFSGYKSSPRIEIIPKADFSLIGHDIKVAKIITKFAGE